MTTIQARGTLYAIACGSSSATRIVEPLVLQAQLLGWDVCVITTPMGRKFLNMPRLAQLTKHHIRYEYKEPDEPDLLPRADALVVYPATFRTINNWANGNSDTLAVGLLCEYTGRGTPIVAVPCLGKGSGLDTFPAFPKNIETLRAYGVSIMYELDYYDHNEIPAHLVLEQLHTLIS
jgi:phosphopantothenoylcysteine synthetase/decarboxylase